MNLLYPLIAIGGQLPPIRWIPLSNPPIYTHKTYTQLVQEKVIKPIIYFPHWVDVSALPADYAIVIGTPHIIALKHIVPTQPFVSLLGVAHYLNRTRYTDRDGQLPCGIQFADSSNIYLINGHHRLEASRRAGRKSLRMIIESYPITLEKALRGADYHV